MIRKLEKTTGYNDREKRASSKEWREHAPGGIRTPNLLIRSQMLYPLSYRRMTKADYTQIHFELQVGVVREPFLLSSWS